MFKRIFVLFGVATLLSLLAATVHSQEAIYPDIIGAYLYQSGKIVIINGNTKTDSWRYLDLETGISHKMYRDDARNFHSGSNWSSETPVEKHYRFEVDEGNRATALIADFKGETTKVARRIEFPEITTTFESGDLNLYGKLVLPLSKGPHPVVTIAHGSEPTPAVEGYYFPYLYAANGIATFIYDKRGTGRSEGQYTSFPLFPVLAGDLIAGINWLKSRPEIDASRIGVAGFSQGGWIAPLAASKSDDIRFVLVGYGMAMSVADEDRLEAPLKLRVIGFEGEAIEQFKDFNRTLHEAARVNFENGWNEIEAKVAQYRKTKWFAAVKKTPTTWAGFILNMGLENAKKALPEMLKSFDPFYDPVPTLEKLNIPMLWILGGKDIEAPPEVTIAVLERLRTELGKPLETVIFPHADHGIVEFEEKDRKRIKTNYADGYFSTMTDWLRRQAGVH